MQSNRMVRRYLLLMSFALIPFVFLTVFPAMAEDIVWENDLVLDNDRLDQLILPGRPGVVRRPLPIL